MSEPLLGLFQYFVCVQALHRCEDVMCELVRADANKDMCWDLLPKAVRLNMSELRRMCAKELFSCEGVAKDHDNWNARMAAVSAVMSPSLLLDLYDAHRAALQVKNRMMMSLRNVNEHLESKLEENNIPVYSESEPDDA